jgi:FKBP-type peptidyl-prolyl cis-trans isomerase
MATSKGQRVGIWVIAGVLLVGTLGSFVAMIFQTKNQSSDQAAYNKQLEEYKKYMEAEQKRGDELSVTYYPQLKPYESTPAAFDAATVAGSEVTVHDLKIGEGAEITAETAYEAYYIGWNPKGKVFDSSFNGEKLKAPLTVGQGSVIEGWGKGVTGMKVGGVREISIPSDLAYGEKGSGDDIPPNTPLKFIVMVIATK